MNNKKIRKNIMIEPFIMMLSGIVRRCVLVQQRDERRQRNYALRKDVQYPFVLDKGKKSSIKID